MRWPGRQAGPLGFAAGRAPALQCRRRRRQLKTSRRRAPATSTLMCSCWSTSGRGGGAGSRAGERGLRARAGMRRQRASTPSAAPLHSHSGFKVMMSRCHASGWNAGPEERVFLLRCSRRPAGRETSAGWRLVCDGGLRRAEVGEIGRSTNLVHREREAWGSRRIWPLPGLVVSAPHLLQPIFQDICICKSALFLSGKCNKLRTAAVPDCGQGTKHMHARCSRSLSAAREAAAAATRPGQHQPHIREHCYKPDPAWWRQQRTATAQNGPPGWAPIRAHAVTALHRCGCRPPLPVALPPWQPPATHPASSGRTA